MVSRLVAKQVVGLTAVFGDVSVDQAALPYFLPICMMLGALSFAVGLSFVEGVAIALLTARAFFVSVLIFWPEPSLLVIFHFTWLVTVIVFAGVNSYLLDRVRVAWLQEMDLLHADGQI